MRQTLTHFPWPCYKASVPPGPKVCTAFFWKQQQPTSMHVMYHSCSAKKSCYNSRIIISRLHEIHIIPIFIGYTLDACCCMPKETQRDETNNRHPGHQHAFLILRLITSRITVLNSNGVSRPAVVACILHLLIRAAATTATTATTTINDQKTTAGDLAR
jgi:hypothetical protein